MASLWFNNIFVSVRPDRVQYCALGEQIRMARQMWTIAGAVLNTRVVFYTAFAIVFLGKWTVWFPAMLIQHGFRGARNAALTDPPQRAQFAPRLTGADAQTHPNWTLSH